MDSTTLLEIGFCEWRPFAQVTVKAAPEDRGVYAFRSSSTSGLMTGSSDIVYIGRAMSDKKGAHHNIKHSLNEYLHPGRSNLTKKRVGDRALTQGWQVSWMLTASPDQMECHLLSRFYSDHGQLPAENKHWPPGCTPATHTTSV